MNQKKINQAEWSNADNWSVGFYFSKKDSRTWVPNPIQWMGLTVNLGRRAGACWMLGILVCLPVLMIVMMALACGR